MTLEEAKQRILTKVLSLESGWKVVFNDRFVTRYTHPAAEGLVLHVLRKNNSVTIRSAENLAYIVSSPALPDHLKLVIEAIVQQEAEDAASRIITLAEKLSKSES